MEILAVLILACPLAGFLINGLLGRYCRNYFVSIIACSAPFASFILSIVTPYTSAKIFEWITVGGVSFDLAIKIDSITQVMLLVITGVGFIIHIYSIGYMKGDPGYWRYFAYLNLFIFLMLLLVMADNLLVMFIGWEGVGLCSYLLIGFWYKDILRADAAKKAFIVNRVGDFFFIIGMMILFSWSGSLNISDINIQTSSSLTPLVCIFLFIGACGKSAQFPLYVWLPDAMAGPTPVSALIHAATMVTAGVYMVARLLPLYMNFLGVLEIIAVIGAFSALFTSILAIGENNIKRILAYSTISQLGFMFCGVAAGSIKAGFFHLSTHAFFKALLFLTAGIVIHALDGEEDIRKMGGLRKRLPLAFWAFLIGALSLSGIPPFSGFFSKEEIIHSTYHIFTRFMSPAFGYLITGILLLTTFFTSVYIFRLIAITFFGIPGTQKLHRTDFSMNFAVIVLSILSIFGWILVNRWDIPSQYPQFLLFEYDIAYSPVHTLPSLVALAIFASLAGLVVVFLSFGPLRKKISELLTTKIGGFFNKIVTNKFYVDEIYEYLFVLPLNMIAFVLWYIIDQVIIDTVLINSSSALLYLLSGKARKIQTGLVNLAVAIVALGVVFIIALIFLLKHA